MKKLMIAAAIALVAVASQAACCAWQYKCTTSTDGMDGAKAYIILGTTQPDSFSAVKDITDLSLNGVTGYATTTKTKPSFSNVAKDTIDSESLTKTSPNFYVVLVNSAASGYWMSAVQDATDYLYDAGGSAEATLMIQPSTVSFTNFSSGDVPEPTSAMLILLGVAGLALRRKQA